MTCQEVQRELSNYLDRELPVEVCAGMQDHFRTCERCAALLQDTHDMVLALGDERLVDVPHGYSTRLYRKLKAQLGGPASGVSRNVSTEIPLGITNDVVDLGSHLIYFWQSDEEFAQGVRFLEPGLMGQDHCVVFGHDEATDRVFRLLQAKGFDTESLTQQRRITLLRREAPAGTTLSDIEDVFKAAMRAGAPAIRYLGNLGFGQAPLPGTGIEDVLELEARVTSLAKRFPAVVVCMYDVNTLPGRLILKGGFQTHPVAVCGDHLIDNAYYIPEEDFLREIHRTE
jgi:MEDS: MEthanogen/methylotroph, DcmR Sensory domain/Putative zinc-finger